ncbi:hypothetical protein HMPREF9622_01915 [Cutibacterium modestum HL037PA3]|nr:hypothetical protein HMPREF9622_01915 [Cutibacterium modestum HL037PA3]
MTIFVSPGRFRAPQWPHSRRTGKNHREVIVRPGQAGAVYPNQAGPERVRPGKNQGKHMGDKKHTTAKAALKRAEAQPEPPHLD